LRLPDEVLQKIALVLGQKEILGLVDNLPCVGDKDLALRRQLIRRRGECLGLEEAVEGDVDLGVL
jgi:hypothetical protein